MTPHSDFTQALSRCPLVAIVRGVRPDEVEAVGETLADAGFELIEVPLNSPHPFDSIARLARRLEGRAIVGAGTVLNVGQVQRVRDVGGRLIVSPNTDTAVIAATVDAGLISLPGYFTPSEAFAAVQAGAHALKLFPAEAASPRVLKAQKAVLPRDLPVLVVGGVTPETMAEWTAVGAAGFGIGSALYAPGVSIEELGKRAERFVAAIRSQKAGE